LAEMYRFVIMRAGYCWSGSPWKQFLSYMSVGHSSFHSHGNCLWQWRQLPGKLGEVSQSRKLD
jgi:hypothetical protein